VNLGLRAWSARKYDRKVTEEVNKSHGADSDAGRYNKSLMPADAASYKALTQHITAARERHYEQTLAWSDKGWRLLPIKNYQKYTDTVRKDQHTFDALLAAFVKDYPQLIVNARAKLNGMYDEEDYPANIAGRFGMSLDTNPVPESGDYRVELSQEEIDILTNGTQARVEAAFEEAQNDAIRRLYEVVEKMHTALSTVKTCSKCEGKGVTVESRKAQLKALEEQLTVAGKQDEIGKPVEVTCWICDGKGETETDFRDSLIGNVRDVTAVLENLNLKDDPKLEAIRRTTEKLAHRNDAQTLRDDTKKRSDAAAESQAILDKMKATFGSNLFG
jgi:hypothetical protein